MTVNSSRSTTNKKAAGTEDRRVLLSTLWIVVMFNMLASDILSFMVPGFLAQYVMTGQAEGTPVTLGFLLVAAVLMEIPTAMIFLSRILQYRANRLVNTIAAAITIAFVIGMGSTTPHYVFFETVQAICMLLIIWFAWKWRNPAPLELPGAPCVD